MNHPNVLVWIRRRLVWLILSLPLLAPALATAQKFVAGDRVRANTTLNVRSSPGGTLLGAQSAGAQGTVNSGPVTASLNGVSYQWYNVTWSAAPHGWSVDGGMDKVVSLPGAFTLSLTPECSGSATQIRLNWSASSGASSYDVYRNGSVYYTGITGTQFINTSVTSGTSYTYYVKANNTAGSTNSNSQSAAAPSCGSAPGSFTLTVTPECGGSTSQIRLNWSSASGASSYDVYRNGSQYFTGITGTQFINSSVTAGGSYSYYVKAINAYGSTNSNTSSATAPACGTPTLSVSPSSGQQITTTFSVSGSNYTPNATVYRYVKRPGESGYTMISSITANGAGSISWQFTPDCTQPVGDTYVYVVDAPTSRQSNTIIESISAHPSCTPTLSITAVEPSTVPAQEWGGSVTFTITVKDGNGIPVAGASVGGSDNLRSLSYTTSQTNAGGQTTYTTTVPDGKSDGTYPITFVASKAGYNNSATVTRDVPVNHATVAPDDLFDYPIGSSAYSTQASDGDGWYNAQDFGAYYAANGKYHLGEDWNAESGGNTDCGLAVYAAAGGTVVYRGASSGWGNVIIVRHLLADGSSVETVYGHLQSMSVANAATVARRQQIGTIGDGGGLYICHLHFELRTSNCPNWGQPGPGYSVTAKPAGWVDPSDFIDNHRGAGTNPPPSEIAAYCDQLSLEYKVPSVILKAVIEQESISWKQFNDNGSPIISGDGGIGLMQVTLGGSSATLGKIIEGVPQGQNSFTTTTEVVSVDLERLKSDWRYNVLIGARILVAKKVVSAGAPDDAGILENWYYPLAYYNGTGTASTNKGCGYVNDYNNNPCNTIYSRTVSVNSDFKSSRVFPYQECIYNIIARKYSIPADRAPYFDAPTVVTLPGPAAVGTGDGQFSYVEPVFCFFDWAMYYRNGRVEIGNWGSSVTGCISERKTVTGITVHPVSFGSTLPIVLFTFSAGVESRGVRLAWSTVSELNNLGFYIERRSGLAEPYRDLPNGFVPGSGTTLEEQQYSWLDSTVGAGTYYYRLRQVDLDGTVNYSSEVTVTVNGVLAVADAGIPRAYQLFQNYPNPFNPATTIQYALPEPSRVRLEVYSMLGARIALLADGMVEAGYHSVVFAPADLASGVYYYRLSTEKFADVKRMILIR